MRRVFLTGISGQDGSSLAELLLGKGYEVHGTVRRASSFNTGRRDRIYQDPHESRPQLQLHYGDINDLVLLVNPIRGIVPDEVYRSGAKSPCEGVVRNPSSTRALPAWRPRAAGGDPCFRVQTRFYQASSSDMFCAASPQRRHDSVSLPQPVPLRQGLRLLDDLTYWGG
jgi:GDPmannose 4,6-dehydratase